MPWISLLKAFVHSVSSLGVLSLIVVNCIILSRAEKRLQERRRCLRPVDGICQGDINSAPRCWSSCTYSAKFFGAGTFGGGLLGGGALRRRGVEIFPAECGVSVLTLPVGGFLAAKLPHRCRCSGL